MKNAAAALLIAALMIALVSTHERTACAQPPESRGGKGEDALKNASLWMKNKMVASEKILEGMTRADFGQIEKYAQGMRMLTYLERWVRSDVPGYRTQLHTFDYANEAIVQGAREKNLDAVTIAYTQLAISCVQCHKYVRDKVER